MTDIVIVGAGPTGLTLACQLLRRGVACRIVDAAPAASTRSRALAISARSLEVLDEFGAAADLIDRGVRYGVANFNSRGRRIGYVTASSARHTRFPFMLALPQSETEAVLEDHVRRLGGTVARGTRLTGLFQDADAVRLELNGREARADWVVGADGARSAVRDWSGIGYQPSEVQGVFVNVDAYLDDGRPAGEGHYYFSSGAMTVLVGISGGWFRITTMVAEDGDADLTAEDVATMVSERMGRPLRVRELRDSGWGLNRVRIRTGIASSFRSGRCLLAGDAAHVYGPVGAQGMNGGIQDAHNLAWKLALVATGRAGAELLDTYEAERLPVARATLDHVTLQAKLATVRPAIGIAIRDALVSGLTKTGLLDRKLGPAVTQLDTRYPAADRFRGTGTRIPDTPLGTGTLFDVLREHPFTALVLGSHPGAPALAETLRDRFGDLVAVRQIDVDNQLHRHLRVTSPRVCLVRPDGHITFQGSPSGAVDHLSHLLAEPVNQPVR